MAVAGDTGPMSQVLVTMGGWPVLVGEERKEEAEQIRKAMQERLDQENARRRREWEDMMDRFSRGHEAYD